MSLRHLHHALVIALFAAAPVAVAQTAAAPSGRTDTASTSATKHSGHGAATSHKVTHHAAGARTQARSSTASRPTGGSGNAEYDAALRRCVQMSGNERERCLDDAIARYAS